MRHDVIIVGAGATGIWAAHRLTQDGLRVLLIDAGPERSFAEIASSYLDERRGLPPAPFDATRQPIQSRHPGFTRHNALLFVDDVAQPYAQPDGRSFHWYRGRQIGGRLHTWGRTSLRLSDYELAAASHDQLGDDWPLRHAELDRHYARVERGLGVLGTVAHLPQLPDGVYDAAPPRCAIVEEKLGEALRALGPGRSVIPSRIATASYDKLLAAPRASGRLVTRSNAYVERVELEPSRAWARGVLLRHAGSDARERVEAPVVMLCASTIETASLLLRSSDARFPGGLANSSGRVGRNLMEKATAHLRGLVPYLPGATTTRPLVHYGPAATAQQTLIPRFCNLTGGEARAYPRGYGILLSVSAAIPSAQHPSYDSILAEATREHCGVFLMTAYGETLARATNRVTLDATLRDESGYAAPLIDFSLAPEEEAMVTDQLATMREIAARAGFQVRAAERGVPGEMVHEVGTARMGQDRATSVVNPHNQTWDVPNLFITDGSCFVSTGWQNPTLTMMAITDRACDFILRHRGELPAT